LATKPPLPPDNACRECGGLLWCRKKTLGDAIVLEVMVTGTPLHADVERLIESLFRSTDIPRVLMDMTTLDFISSAFMARLMTLNRQVRDAKGVLVLFGLSPFVQGMLVDMKLDGVFHVAEDEEAALATL